METTKADRLDATPKAEGQKPAKKEYHMPELAVYGDIAELTQSNGQYGEDGFTGSRPYLAPIPR